VFAQGGNTSFNWKFEEGNKLMEEKFFNQAAEIWKELLAKDEENANLNYKAGLLSYFNSYNQKAKALPYLEKASAAAHPRAATAASIRRLRPLRCPGAQRPVEVDYYLGRAYHLNDQFDKADMAYQKFLDETDAKHDAACTGHPR
jgi:tetratricopeptide (TPR) repeat protein